MFKAMLTKEFLLIGRDKHALAALFIMPAVFILIMSIALKDVMNDDKSLMSYIVIDRDQTHASQTLVEELAETPSFSQRDYSEETYRSPEDEGVQFIVDIPEGFESDLSDIKLTVAADTSPSLLSIFKSQMSLIVMKHQLDTMSSAIQKQFGSRGGRDVKSFDEEFIEVNYAKFAQNEKPTSTQQSVPSWIVFGLFFVIIPMSTIFINEKKQNTLRRLLTMNVSILNLFAGKIIPYMLINQVQVWLMIGVGMFVVPYFGAAPLTISGSVFGLILVSIALSISAIGLSILIATSVDSVEQATTIGGIINILLGAIGGVMVPKVVMPESMQTLSNISPMSWGLEGFLDIFLRSGGVRDIIPEAIALSLFGLISLSLAAVIFTFKKRKEA
ncbi:ABC transporter permease [Vibrio diazotrophicus]|uniref:ABC transporter permease n=1 Tax=Vibrio diazotrophicus TaxID=685 RepID=A0ABX4WDG7_VIBDI|nr:ABC transporter permease [Vibrio diazotrophicus]MCZ4371059.1 ABC transporter permease [Vibrio diazotrophicus]PNI02387.1 ABC transporter permease [Vibrio diazotrophicus]